MAKAETNDTAADAPPAGAAAPKFQPGDLVVDSKVVDEAAYFKAAPLAGYDPDRLRAINYRPALSTIKPGA